jgi:hypothetical protein
MSNQRFDDSVLRAPSECTESVKDCVRCTM